MVVLGVFLEDILGSLDGLVPFLLLDGLVDALEQGLGARHGAGRAGGSSFLHFELGFGGILWGFTRGRQLWILAPQGSEGSSGCDDVELRLTQC